MSKIIELRRHSRRDVPQPHLNQAGVDLARRIGDEWRARGVRFDRAITSSLPRAIETAVAFGVAVYETRNELAHMDDAALEAMGWSPDASMADMALALRRYPAAARFAQTQADVLQELLDELRDGASLLVVSHGGILEAGALALTPDADHATWGDAFSYCEGVRITLDANLHATDIRVLRVHSASS
jgi:broad specificity phosphatase PhoE